MHVIAHKSTYCLQLLSVLVAVQVTAGPMQPQAESSFTGKSRPDMHSCTSHLGCQQRRQSTMSLLMALEVDVHKRDQELKAACCIRHGHMLLSKHCCQSGFNYCPRTTPDIFHMCRAISGTSDKQVAAGCINIKNNVCIILHSSWPQMWECLAWSISSTTRANMPQYRCMCSCQMTCSKPCYEESTFNILVQQRICTCKKA